MRHHYQKSLITSSLPLRDKRISRLFWPKFAIPQFLTDYTSVKSSTKLFVIQSAKEFFEPSSDEKITNVSWLIEGWPFDEVYLDCEKETELGLKDVGKEIFLDYRLVPILKLTLSFPPRTVPDAFNCNLMDGSRILEEHLFRKYDKGNTSDIAVVALIVAIATFVAICAVTVILFKPDLFKKQHIFRVGGAVRVATHAQGNDDSNGDSVATKPITFTPLKRLDSHEHVLLP